MPLPPESSPLQGVGIGAAPEWSDLPFRWDIPRRERLGGLLEGEQEEAYRGFRDDLIQAGARVLGFTGDTRLVFVGRSPESLFDLL